MALRKFNFEEELSEKDRQLAKELSHLKARAKFDQQSKKLVADEKRWLRKARLARTKLQNITAGKRRLRARIKAFDKSTKEGN